MIIVRIWGGIGNQLFQYVFGQYLNYKYGQEVKYDDNAFFSVDKLRKRELNALDMPIDYDNSCGFSKHKGVRNRLGKFLFLLNPKHHFLDWTSKLPESYNNDDLYFIQGYWQEYKYIEWLRNNEPSFKLRSSNFPVELAALKEKIESDPNAVSVHVRRGDYFAPENVKLYGVCDAKYYEQAVKELCSRMIAPTIYVFSDDLDWVKENIHFDAPVTYIPNYEISQFAYIELMSFCKHHIISNSSFSWWGAVMNMKEDAIVITPDRWRLDKVVDMALDSWIKIKPENK